MSVVNQMLRDLDRREAGEESAVYTQHLRPVNGRRRRPIAMIGMAILIALAATYVVLQYLDRTTPAVESANAGAPIAMRPVSAEAPAEPAAPIAETDVEEEPIAAAATSSAAQTTDGYAAAISTSESITTPASDVKAQTAMQTVPAHSRENGNERIVPAPALDNAGTSKSAAGVTPVAPATSAAPPVEAAASATKIDVRPHAPSARSAESEFRRAAALLNQARSAEARAALQAALELDAGHEGARQTLAVLLIEARALSEAEVLLVEGLKLNPNQSNFAIVLARLKLEHGDTAGALQVLREHSAAAAHNAEYRAFTAALLQRTNRHAEALDEYRAALAVSPNVGVWWVGLGLSFEATAEPDRAAEAFMRARATGTLSADVAQFIEGKLQAAR